MDYQAPLPVEFSRQECWSGLPLSTTGDLPNPGIEPAPLASPALAGGSFTTSAAWEALLDYVCAAAQLMSDSAMLWIVAPQAPLSVGVLQARVLEWFAMPFSRASSQPRNWTHVSLRPPNWQTSSLPLASPGKPLTVGKTSLNAWFCIRNNGARRKWYDVSSAERKKPSI